MKLILLTLLSTLASAASLGTNAIVAIDNRRMLVVRDHPKQLRRMLEVSLAHILIEGVIFEVPSMSPTNVGLSYADKLAVGTGNVPTRSRATRTPVWISATNSVSVTESITAGGQPGGFCYLASMGSDLEGMERTLTRDDHVRILQRPHIETSQAVPATMFVGDSRSLSANCYSGGAIGSPLTRFLAGVTFEVTPVVQTNGVVQMDIHVKIDKINRKGVKIANIGWVPIGTSNEAQAKVAVRDHETVILGGLVETPCNRPSSGVPVLKHIPLLGIPFRGSSAGPKRTELVVLVRPTVLANPAVAALADLGAGQRQ